MCHVITKAAVLLLLNHLCSLSPLTTLVGFSRSKHWGVAGLQQVFGDRHLGKEVGRSRNKPRRETNCGGGLTKLQESILKGVLLGREYVLCWTEMAKPLCLCFTESLDMDVVGRVRLRWGGSAADTRPKEADTWELSTNQSP